MTSPDHTRLSRFAGHLEVPRSFVDVLSGPSPDRIDLVGGNPATEALPGSALMAALATHAPDDGWASLQYSSPRGLPALVEWIAEREGVSADRVVVTNGALHALALVTLALVDPGDDVVVDDPVYPVFRRVLELSRARPVPIRVDEGGLDVRLLEESLSGGLRPRLVYTVPDFQNPTGTCLTAPRRERLLELAEEYGFVVVSDNPYRRTRWSGTELPAIDRDSDRVVHVDTFSKSLGPGLRLGWLVVPSWLAPTILALRSRTDQHPSTLIQTAVTAFVTEPGAFDRLASRIARTHRERAETLVRALTDALGGDLDFREPEGGFFLWATAADPAVDVAAVKARSARLGTSFTLGSAFAVPGGDVHDRSLRLGFSSTPSAGIPLAVERLATAVRESRTGGTAS